MELDAKKKGVLILSVAGLLAVVVLLGIMVFYKPKSKDEGEGEKRNVVSEIPGAETANTPDSKKKAFDLGSRSQSNIADYWENSVGEGDEIDRQLGGGGSAPSSSGISKVSTDDKIDAMERRMAQQQEERMREEERRAAARDRQMDKLNNRNDALVDAYLKQSAQGQQEQEAQQEPKEPEAPPVEQRDKIDVERVTVRRSNGISSMDSSMDSGGVYSWDEEMVEYDDAYPFKVMFVKQEKLTSGERVTIRLLEDMIIDGQLVPANTHLMATCNIGSRIDLNVSSINYRGRILSLDYDAYDNDGVKGIYAPSLDDSKVLEQLGQVGVNAGMRTMRSTAGRYVQDLLQAGQVVLSTTKNGKERVVYVPAGYQFYLVKSKHLRSK